ncbi:hypothetical protein PFLUV_G00228640 [Perca fluviatilis]|uniref:KASH domain-containing protein n=1 Tax=Perca fluviatilis TaxID=8168 RepID=A0A6A5EEK6_PERFL|nr:nesprin-2-like [Perca fluviatilis]KAF1374393.1 hypothetical protein PFLUV_G00228640 [Perca fluviatilis]
MLTYFDSSNTPSATAQQPINTLTCLLLQEEEEDDDDADATVGQTATGREERRRSSLRRQTFFRRVLRAAFPLHLLFFTLLVLTGLLPMSEDHRSCTLANNLARSFYPTLRYIDGPPPT